MQCSFEGSVLILKASPSITYFFQLQFQFHLRKVPYELLSIFQLNSPALGEINHRLKKVHFQQWSLILYQFWIHFTDSDPSTPPHGFPACRYPGIRPCNLGTGSEHVRRGRAGPGYHYIPQHVSGECQN